MRIITGKLKGRRLAVPKGESVRPTPEKAREAVFSMVLPYMPEGFVAADAFCGSGSLGLESISRGASKVYFSDVSKEHLNYARKNAEHCKVSDLCLFVSGDYRKLISFIESPVDLWFLDPPYESGLEIESLEAVAASGLVAEDGIVVCEYSRRVEMPSEMGNLTRIKERNYGRTNISIYRMRDTRGGIEI